MNARGFPAFKLFTGMDGRKKTGRLLLSLLLVFLLLLSLAGCAQPSGSGPSQSGNPAAGTRQPVSAGAAGSGLQSLASGEMRVSVIDVGQGDSILVQLPDGKTMLVDGGPTVAGPNVAAYLRRRGVKRIDYLVATHPHEDHIGGLPGVLPQFPIGQIFMTRGTTNTATFEHLLQGIKNKGLSVTTARAGVVLFQQGTLQAVFLAPSSSGYKDLNNWSAVIRLQYGNAAFLLTGDAQAQSEQEMLASGANLRADVLKVGHHGSATSTGPAFLRAVAPRFAVISVGAGNDYGHPHQVTLNKLQQAGVQVYRTDQDGTVVFTTDGKQIRVDCLPRQAVPGGIRGFVEWLRMRLFGN